MKRFAQLFLLPLLLASAVLTAQPPAATKDAVWSREVTYWKTVQAGDIVAYRSLWRDDFLGWPYSSTDPAGKAQIADWITAHKAKGEHLESYSLERLNIQVSGDMATTTYRVRAIWAGQSGKQKSGVSRVLHIWRRDSDGTWRIFSGMSAPADGK